MKKKSIALVLIVALSMLMSACGEKTENNVDTSASTSESVSAEESTEESAEGEEVYEYPSEDVEPMEYESDLGYSIIYDPSVITLDDTGEGDIFTYNTAEELDAPVYISVMRYNDMDAETLAGGIILQSGIDGL